jgi:Na+/phosphate symporter
MNREETKAILAVLKAGYPNFYKDMSAKDATNIVDLWAKMFTDNPAHIITEAVKSLMCTLRFPPTIADVKEKISLITQPQTMTEMEAWRMVMSAINYYNATETFERLPPILRRIVGSPNQLREWAVMEAETVNSVIQSNFMRSYRAIVTQEKERAMLPESTKQMINGLAERMALTDGGD